ncbi:MAG: type II toxin-antitoxin system VapC family toxin [bacterium]
MKELNYFIDTNIFLRTLVNDNEKFFNECVSFLELVKSRKIKAQTSCLVLSEVSWTLSSFYNSGKDKVVESLYSIVNLKNLKFNEKFNSSFGVQIYEQNNIKLTDALIASHPKIQSKEMIVVSYDKDFDKLGIIRKEPGQIIKNK